MRGTFVAKPLIFKIEVGGDDFCQGDRLDWTMTIENPGDGAVICQSPALEIGVADLKKLKARSSDAVEIIAVGECPAQIELGPRQSHKISWTYQLDPNCVISDTGQSLCVVYGSKAAPDQTTQLPFAVKPHRYIQQAITTFESPFQFVVKGQKSANGWLDVKMKPPSARRLVLLDELVAGFRFSQDALELRYSFKVKSFDTSANAVNVKKQKSVVDQRLESRDYLLTKTHINLDLFEKKIQEALETVSTGL